MRGIAGKLRDRLEEARDALIFLTRLPLASGTPRPLARTAWAFPLVGAAVGGLAGGVMVSASHFGLHPLASALLGLAAAAILTGALHEDGLADTADGLGSGRGRERALEIMRDSRIGAFGALTLILVIGLKASITAGLSGSHVAWLAWIVAHAVSRSVMVAAMGWLSPARQDGLSSQAGQPSLAVEGTALGLGALVSVAALGPGVGTAAVLGAVLPAGALGWLAHRRLGGQTGDVLGAIQQAAETGVLLGAALALP